MRRVKCEKCGSVAKPLYARCKIWEADEKRFGWYKCKLTWLRVGYICEKCGAVKLYGKFYTKEANLKSSYL